MRKERRYTLIELLVFVPIILFVFMGGCWLTNAYRMFQCDFDSNKSWKGEIVHGVGVFVPPLSVVTVWFDDK